MKKEYPDASRKKLVGELLKNTDKLLKVGDYEQALSEVEKSLELEPGNFYAQAYKERITALREKYGESSPAAGAAPETPRRVDPAIPEAETVPEDEGEDTPGTEHAETRAGADPVNLREQIARERADQESETQRQAEEIARKSLEQEIHQGAAAGKMMAAAREAAARAIEEGRLRARSELIARYRDGVGSFLASGDVEGAFAELSRLTIVDPEYPAIAEFDRQISAAAEENIVSSAGEGAAEGGQISREMAGEIFGNILKAAWREGTPNASQAEVVDKARKRLEITPGEERQVMSRVQREVVNEAMREAYRDGDPNPETRSFLDRLTTELSQGLKSFS